MNAVNIEEPLRRVAAACRLPEAALVEEALKRSVLQPHRADVLWLTWVQWRALGREAMVRETGLSLWTVTSRLRQMRDAGIPIPSWTQELDMLARGQFHRSWDNPPV